MKHLLILWLILLNLMGVAQVPDTPNVSLSAVKAAIGTTGSLATCFSLANPSGFDATYAKSGDWLSEFRNYQHGSVDLSDLTYVSTEQVYIGTTLQSIPSFSFNNDGSNMYSTDAGGVFRIGLNTPYDLSSHDINDNDYRAVIAARVTEMLLDGSAMITVAGLNNDFYQFDLTPPFDITSMDGPSTSSTEIPTVGVITDIQLFDSGTKMLVPTYDGVYQYTVTTPYNPDSGLTLTSSAEIGSHIKGATWVNDGTRLIYSNGVNLIQKDYSTPYSLSSVTGSTVILDISAQTTDPGSVRVHGNTLYVCDHILFTNIHIYSF